MRKLSGILILLVFAMMTDAQVTRTATFENYASKTNLGTKFTDPSSGITFEDSTSSEERFGISSNGLPEFGGENYLSSDSSGGYAAYFGFTANLPSSANLISLEIAWTGTPPGSSGITLEGFSSSNASGTMISSLSIANATDPYILQITSSQYDMNSFEVVANGVFTGYDNISYTVLPEPRSLGLLLIAGGIGSGRKKYPRR